MQRHWFLSAILLALLASQPTHACRIRAATVLADVKYADVVLVGRISNYGIVRDHEERQRMLKIPNLSAEMRKMYEDPTETLLWDYARFDVEVDEVLVGKAPRKITATWDNSTFGEPGKMAPGPFLIALRDPSSKGPPIRGPSATILPSRERRILTVLQAPCAGPFLFDAQSEEARTVRQILKAPAQ